MMNSTDVERCKRDYGCMLCFIQINECQNEINFVCLVKHEHCHL
jgi:hypothetical protein